jgi:signal transduction histidine kinase
MIIKASLRTLRRESGDAEAAARAVADIEGEAVRLNRLVNEVLDYARPLTFTRDRVDLDRLLADAVQATRAGQPGPEIHLSTTRVGEVLTDGDRLRQALLNVLSNAREACTTRLGADDGEAPAAGRAARPGEPMVEVQAGPAGAGEVEILVRDRGTGIASEDLGRIFEPFFTTKQTGSGIGLAITRNIIEGLGGAISIESAAGRGTIVRLTLPRGDVAPAAPVNP